MYGASGQTGQTDGQTGQTDVEGISSTVLMILRFRSSRYSVFLPQAMCIQSFIPFKALDARSQVQLFMACMSGLSITSIITAHA